MDGDRFDHRRSGIYCWRTGDYGAWAEIPTSRKGRETWGTRCRDNRRGQRRSWRSRMKSVYTWGAILVIVIASVIGDVLLARAMKQVGDVGELRRRVGV